MRRALAALAAVCAAAGLAACGGGPAPTSAHQAAGGSVHPPGWGKPGPASVTSSRLSASQTATMFDTITLGTVPANPFALAGYTSGSWPTYLPLRRAYPNAHVVSIAVTPVFHADCLDVEPGDADPSQAAAWVKADIAAGFAKPCVYSSYYEYVNQVRPDLAAAGISRSQVFEWDADYTYSPHIDTGFDATQWTDHYNGLNLDASLVQLPFLSIAQPPWVAPKPPVQPKCFPGLSKSISPACQHARTVVAAWQNEDNHVHRLWIDLGEQAHALACHAPFKRTSCKAFGQTGQALAAAATTLEAQIAALKKKYG